MTLAQTRNIVAAGATKACSPCACVIGTHTALWFLPLPESVSGLALTFFALIAVPLIAAQCAYYSLFEDNAGS